MKKLALLAMLSAAACETTIPASDSTQPLVSLSLTEGGLRTILSTDPAADLDTGCPAGTQATGAAANAYILAQYGLSTGLSDTDMDSVYFYMPSEIPFKFLAVTNDQGGAAVTRVGFSDSTISASRPEGSVAITELSPASATTFPFSETRPSGTTYTYRIVENRGDVSSPRTALIMNFTTASLGSQPLISVKGDDFSGNSAYGLVWLLPRSLCL